MFGVYEGPKCPAFEVSVSQNYVALGPSRFVMKGLCCGVRFLPGQPLKGLEP